MKELIRKTMERLKKEKLRPLPKWRFVLIDASFWALIVSAVLFSAVAVAVGGYLLFQIDWEALRYMRGGSVGIFFLYVPYIWFAILAVLLASVFYFIRKTKEGYKYKWVVILFSFLVSALSFGIVAHFARVGKIADDFAYRRIPLYGNFTPGMERMWQRSDDGFLAGTINSIGKNKVEITDLAGNKWEVIISKETVLGGPLEIEEASFVKIIGRKQTENIFKADTIISGMGRMMRGFDGSGMHRGGMIRGMGW